MVTEPEKEKQPDMMPNILAQLTPFMSPPNAGATNKMDDQNDDFNTFACHRRAVSHEAEQILPQLTSPLSPPAFNPNEVLLGSNEAIAGLESPAPAKTPKNDAFNWLDSKMMDLRIGKKSMNSLAKEKTQQVSRNATVFQFPETQQHQQPRNNPEAIYATVNKPKLEEKQVSEIPAQPSNHLPGCNLMSKNRECNYGAIMKNPTLTQNENIYAKVIKNQVPPGNPIQQVPKQENTYGAIMKNPVSGNPPMITPMMKNPVPGNPVLVQDNIYGAMMKNNAPPTYGQVPGPPMVQFSNPPNYTKPPPPTNPTSWPIMTQSYPGPGILQPQKAVQPVLLHPKDQEKNMDKEFLAELEKNLGLAEATNNLMPPSPMPVENQKPPNQPQQKSPVPLLPPPQSSGRPRRDKVLRRENSLPRANKPLIQDQTGPLRVALPEEQQPKKLAHVKPFSSPSKSGMGDVASAKGTWKRLIPNEPQVGQGASGGPHSDMLAAQRKQLAEVERRHKSQTVLPPSGTDRPTNHLEVNKMAQVRKTNLFEKTWILKWNFLISGEQIGSWDKRESMSCGLGNCKLGHCSGSEKPQSR